MTVKNLMPTSLLVFEGWYNLMNKGAKASRRSAFVGCGWCNSGCSSCGSCGSGNGGCSGCNGCNSCE